MNSNILDAIKKGELILFLGAGASFGCKTSIGAPIPLSGELAILLAAAASLEYQGESLDAVYEAAREILGVRLDSVLEQSFKHVTPSMEYDHLAKYVWRRIYTLNIDDGLDRSLTRNSRQNVNKLSSRDPVIDKHPFFTNLEYIKLNGTADRLQDGVIFSPSEYAEAAASHLPWYSQCASDFVRSPILFIGTQLNEPLLKFHIERYKALNPEPQGTSYLIARSATPIQIAGLKRYKIEYIEGTLEKFVSWLKDSIPTPPEPFAVAQENIPQLRALAATAEQEKLAALFEHVTAVKRDRFPIAQSSEADTIRDFYKGFKPTWNDIIESIPAELEVLTTSIERLNRIDTSKGARLLPFIGPAGAGKTTLLMQVCWSFSHQPDWDVYFIGAEPSFLVDTLVAIENSSPASKVLVAIDNIEFSIEYIETALKSQRLSKTLIIGAERESNWNRRGKHALQGLYQNPIFVREFTVEDAKKILAQLKLYGSWTRLGKMSEQNRIKELVDRSKKQLLIALLEATVGRGFEEIIEEEYSNIKSEDERIFLVVVAIITDRRCIAPISLVDRALDKLSILRRANAFAEDLAGIVHRQEDTVTARHPVYAKYLIDRAIDPTIAAKAINALLQAFSDYEAPVIRHVQKSEAVLYKSLINHKFLFDVLKGNQTRIIQTYRELEKKFESDGLFWLQYGLALRDFGQHPEALEKLRIACAAYSMPHTLHALAQQLLLSAMEMQHSTVALSLADEAKQILEKLDDIIESDDTYPLITLAEGYTTVLRRHATEDDARSSAKTYTSLLQSRVRQHPENDRLKSAYERLFRYASVGIWQD
ncbi:SIR2 family protein [Pseudomonas sp. BF-R-05]|uniref:P-loop NTPase n=1 Tax=Pseudomonas sp. BF-R-05 TaxID=2832364 RepID=UPI001CBEBB70|nr:SIR2 family protein [Pseudomonas sp. BF-R-05]